MNSVRWFQPLLVLLLAVSTNIAVALGGEGPLRHLAVFAFLLVGPGLALTQWFNIRDLLYEGVVAVGLSLALATAVALVMTYTHVWVPASALSALLIFCVVASVMRLMSLLEQDGRISL
ncbi:hypothetical protein [Deinococcus peraridilitoris]|uniref:Uncharacterized protein n=1 Tax=Deinococcus peraridilitoris (strain DSM 19664 / LMG 22246 / CIP 109416 / KR-200) TaxID=937777 RepID=L0A341_DEIPD|nr:hypothetical protein [Deinococcus peraridilitoris]AFZ68261.1 hypothetical protein Deipe_2797 [Deinococcus peraridilitoris DSM 19664]